MSNRYAHLVQRLREAVLTGRAEIAPSIREAVEAHGAIAGGASRPAAGAIPPALASYVNKVARHAYRVSDADVDALRAAGVSEDAIFEITASTAVGAGIGRLERGLAVLRGER
jgi:alkylhydroperoxidase family enzyme